MKGKFVKTIEHTIIIEIKEPLKSLYTVIRFGKFEEITVLMAKTCNFDAEINDFNST
jgi:hypothetical protein